MMYAVSSDLQTAQVTWSNGVRDLLLCPKQCSFTALHLGSSTPCNECLACIPIAARTSQHVAFTYGETFNLMADRSLSRNL